MSLWTTKLGVALVTGVGCLRIYFLGWVATCLSMRIFDYTRVGEDCPKHDSVREGTTTVILWKVLCTIAGPPLTSA
jgi:hypothetical protein